MIYLYFPIKPWSVGRIGSYKQKTLRKQWLPNIPTYFYLKKFVKSGWSHPRYVCRHLSKTFSTFHRAKVKPKCIVLLLLANHDLYHKSWHLSRPLIFNFEMKVLDCFIFYNIFLHSVISKKLRLHLRHVWKTEVRSRSTNYKLILEQYR